MPPSKTKKSPSRPLKIVLDLGRKVIDAFRIRESEQAKEPKAVLKLPSKPYRVVELFAGVGGFRIGLESVLKGKAFKVVWSNQYEPGSAKQWASRSYEYAFPNEKGSKHSNKLIEDAISEGEVPPHDVLVGGFPCQDYSVAKPNNQSKGIEGKKGVLWWSIYEIAQKHKPEFLILENVDRLVKSPAKQRGRDFAIMLKCLADLGYVVEWRVINAAEYGMPQRRRRVFIVGYKAKEKLGQLRAKQTPENVLLNDGILARAFPVQTIKPSVVFEDDDAESNEEIKVQEQMELFLQASWSTSRTIIEGDPHEITENFNKGNAKHDPFMNAGLMIPSQGSRPSVWTAKVYPKYEGDQINLGDLLTPDKKVPEVFHIDKESLKSWVHQKGSKTETRTNYLTTFTHIQALFEEIGIKAKLTNTQKRTWGKELATYWKDNPTVGKSLKLKDEETGQEVSVSWKLISDTRFDYEFKEGPLPMPDPLDRPFRTIITSEGGSSPSRFKHVICRDCAKNWAKKRKVLDHNCVKAGNFRRLTPEELEQGNMFPAGHTRYCMIDGEKVEVDPKHRAFFMGNALVVGIVQRIGNTLVKGCGVIPIGHSLRVAREKLFDRNSDFTLNDSQSLLRWALWLKGKSLRDSLDELHPKSRRIALDAAESFAKAEIRPDGTFKGPKGILGVLTEIIHFGLAPDNAAAADLKEAGLELKVTGLVKNSNGIRAKERLSLGMIDYGKCIRSGKSFEDDLEIQKSLNGILLMTYWYKAREANPLDLVFHDSIIWKPQGLERMRIRQDWTFIQGCIQSGNAHMLSERYAYALGAPPKGAGKDTDFQAQPVRQPTEHQKIAKQFISLGVEEEQATYAANDFKERSKRPGNSTKGYALPKDLAFAKQIGPFPARRRCYSLTNSYLTKIIRSNLSKG